MNKKTLKKIWLQVPPDYYEKGIARNFFQNFWHTQKWEVVRKMIKGNPKSILDVGCASGWLTARVARMLPKASVAGVDVSPKMIDYAKVVHPHINFVQADAHKLPFPDGSFDLIICTETLEHVVDPLKVLREVGRCLTKQGEAIISMDTGSLLFKITWFFWTKTKGKVWQKAHLHKFNRRKLQKIFKKAGFKIKRQEISQLGMEVTFELIKT